MKKTLLIALIIVFITSKKKIVENKELIQLLYTLKNKHIVIFKHVRSHQKEPDDNTSELYNIWRGNYMADYLATSACKIFVENKKINENNIVDDIIVPHKKINKKKIKNILNI